MLKFFIPGMIPLFIILGIVTIAFSSLLHHTDGLLHAELWKNLFTDPYFLNILQFSFYQATLSTILSLFVGVFFARSLFITQLYKKTHLMALLNLPIIMPVIIAIFGIASVFGNNGWINNFLSYLSFPKYQFLYNIKGILIAHCFFNIPLITRFCLQIYTQIPFQTWRLAEIYNMSGWQRFRNVEWPNIKANLTFILGIVFLLCFTSFAIILTLGGGPKSTTVEVAIYYAFKMELDWQYATMLSIFQLVLCSLLYLLFMLTIFEKPTLQFHKISENIDFLLSKIAWIFHIFFIGLNIFFIMLPIIAIFISGTPYILQLFTNDRDIWSYIFKSLSIAMSAAIITVTFSISLLLSSQYLKIRTNYKKISQIIESTPLLMLGMSPIILGTGLYLYFYQFSNFYRYSWLIVSLLHSLIFLPFAMKYLKPCFEKAISNYDQLCLILNLSNCQIIKYVFSPLLFPSTLRAFSLVAALSLGDISAILLFGHYDLMTISLYLYQKLAHYEFHEAGAIACLLIILCLFIFLICESIIKGSKKMRGEI